MILGRLRGMLFIAMTGTAAIISFASTDQAKLGQDKNIGFRHKRMFIEYGHVQGKCLSENNTLRGPHERICRNCKRRRMLPEK